MSDRPLFIRLTLPSGLEDILEGLAKEVLRHKPSDIYEFSALHFEDLLRRRDGLCTSYYDDFGTKGSILSDIENVQTLDNEETPDITIEPFDNPFEEPSDECDIEYNDVLTRTKSIDIQLPTRVIGVDNDSVTDVHDFLTNEDSSTNECTLEDNCGNLSDIERPKTPNPENNHIRPMENAATQIQSGFKGMSSRGRKVIDSEKKDRRSNN
ncbi:uncharacterized protein [Lepeophtheirus salmonis]|uniref:uncharacterized protein n=1 Tax=Lepeophtheirus salmonis TaxID=72036 RepID=UPI001AE32B73|nr:uncharacterized protein LOC121117911 [Lepeophtheirus salmonis]